MDFGPIYVFKMQNAFGLLSYLESCRSESHAREFYSTEGDDVDPA